MPEDNENQPRQNPFRFFRNNNAPNNPNLDRAFNPWQERARDDAIEMEQAIANREDIGRRQMRINPGQVVDTVGIELESLGLTRDRVSRILAEIPGVGSNFKVSRDGSSEINIYSVPLNQREAINVSAHTETAEILFSGKYPKNTSGYELISVPMLIDTAEITLHGVLPALEANGDFYSERCATHIHVGGMKNLSFLKNALKLGLWLDELFFSLAHMDGKRFRGYSNNAIYARPLINGPYFKYNRDYYQVLNWENALDAGDLYEFFASYGANVGSGELNKYHPGRYFSINLYSIPRIGTLEFRHFNQTFNPKIVTAVAKLCQLFVEVSVKARMNQLVHFEPGNVFVLQPHNYYLNKLHTFLDFSRELECDYDLTSEDIKILTGVICNYNGIGVENSEVLTHCTNFEVPTEVLQDGSLRKSKNKPIPDGHTDIHNIKYSPII